MRKILTIFLAAVVTASLAACGNGGQETPSGGVIDRPQQSQTSDNGQTGGDPSADDSSTDDPSATDSQNDPGNASGGSKILIAYFTVPETDGVDTVANASRVSRDGEVIGNTEFIASVIQQTLGGDLFAIETVQEYPGSHEPLLDFAYNEKSDNARPELSTHIENLSEYDVIFIGFPNWNADLPMPLYTLFEEYDFSGKTLIPFVTHGGSGFSGTIRTIKGLEPDAAVVEEGLSVSRNSVASAEDDVKAWAESLLKD